MEIGLSTQTSEAEGAELSSTVDVSLTADNLRAHEYSMLAVLLSRTPDQQVLDAIARLKGDVTPLGLAHIHLAEAAGIANPNELSREFFNLFVGVGRGELVPFGSYYLTGFLQEKPLARLRADLLKLGIERAPERRVPEDHIAILCEIMSGMCSGTLDTRPGADRHIFERHLKPWAARFFADLEVAENARFYRHVGAIGRMFMQIETEALAWAA